MSDIKQLAAEWMAAKEAEKVATEERRKIEDKIKVLVAFAEDSEGTETIKPDEYIIKIAGRIDRKVDGEKVQELAAEFGLTEHLPMLFRWKPEINMAIWKAADESITKPLAAAITAKPGRPSFSITIKE